MKLHYFDFPAKAESIRLLLTHAKVKFEDVRYTPDEWPANKDKFELKQIPVLEEDGKVRGQSGAILEYLGRKYGYLPKDNPEEHYTIIKIVEIINDLYKPIFAIMSPYSPLDEKAKEECKKRLFKVDGPLFLKSIERTLCENECKDFLVGDKYTIADFAALGLYVTVKTVKEWNEALFGKFIKKAPLLYVYLEKRLRDFNGYYKRCKYKLYYFSTPGLGEKIRMLLKYLKIEFEDIKYTNETWPAVKATGKFELGKVPVLECEPCGLKLSQSDAIMQWLGTEFGLLPEDDEKFSEVLWWNETAKDVMENCWKIFMPVSEEKKKELMKNLCEKTAVNCFSAMEERLKKNGSEDHLVGTETTIAEFYLVGMYRACIINDAYKEVKAVMDKYPKLKEFIEKKHKEY